MRTTPNSVAGVEETVLFYHYVNVSDSSQSDEGHHHYEAEETVDYSSNITWDKHCFSDDENEVIEKYIETKQIYL